MRPSRGPISLLLLLLPLSLLTPILGAVAHANSLKDEAIAITQTHQKYGPEISRAAKPELYELLAPVVEILQKAHLDWAREWGIEASAKFEILDSPIVNAVVTPLRDVGGPVAKNLVFITTGMLEVCFREYLEGGGKAADKYRAGVLRVAGILAHEWAHPFENYGPDYVPVSAAKRMIWSQGNELYADSRGTLLARRAGLPPEVVYMAHQHLEALIGKDLGGEATLGVKAVITHPDQALRLSVQRLLLTYDRYRRGSAKPDFTGGEALVNPSRMRQLLNHPESWEFQEPSSISDAVKRIESLTSSQFVERFKKLEFNRLLLWLDERVVQLERSHSLSAPEKDQLTAFFEKIAQNAEAFPPILQSDEIAKFMTAESKSARFALAPSHFSRLEEMQFVRMPEYFERLKPHLNPSSAPNGAELAKRVIAASKVLPYATLEKQFFPEIEQLFIRDWNPRGGGGYIDTLAAHLDEPLRLKFGKRILESLHAQSVPVRKRFLNQSTPRHLSLVPAVQDSEDQVPGRGKLIQALWKNLHAEIWKDRGFYAAHELMYFGNVDWDAILLSQGIPREQGVQQIQKAAAEFMATEGYGEMLDNMRRVTAFKTPIWLSEKLLPSIAGLHLPAGPKQAARQEAAAYQIASDFLAKDLVRFEVVYKNELRAVLTEGLKKGPLSRERFLELERGVESKLFPGNNSAVSSSRLRVVAEVLDEVEKPAGHPKAETVQLFRELFLTPPPNRVTTGSLLTFSDYVNEYGWIHRDIQKKEDLDGIIRILKKQGLIISPLQFFSQAARRANDPYIASKFEPILSWYREDINQWLKAEIQAAPPDRRVQIFLNYARAFLDTKQETGKAAEARKSDILAKLGMVEGKHSGIFRMKADFIRFADTLSLSPAELREFFEALTGAGTTPETDAFFVAHRQQLLHAPGVDPEHAWLPRILEERRIQDTTEAVGLSESLLRAEFHIELQPKMQGRASPERLEELFKRVDALAPSTSFARDGLLEKFAWELGLRGEALQHLVEKRKVSELSRLPPGVANVASGAANIFQRLKPATREDLLAYFAQKHPGELPASFKREVPDLPWMDPESGGDIAKVITNKTEAAELSFHFEAQLENFARRSSPEERIPLLDLLLNAGKDPREGLAPDEAAAVARKHLGYVAGSKEEKFLLAFLNTVDAHERSVTLAYLLSQVGQDKGNASKMFEIFQTVGIKFGQLSSIWKILGEELSEQTKGLKDNAKPMTLAEIEGVMKTHLSPEDFTGIKIRKILGSASVKTVVEVELRDGRQAVMMVVNPHAEAQIQSNLQLARKFLVELEAQGYPMPGGMFQSLVEDLESQLRSEVKLLSEISKIKDASRIYGELNQLMKDELQGYRFRVPGVLEDMPASDSLIFCEKAEGVSWDRLLASGPKREIPKIGRSIARGGLLTFFRFGFINPDPHGGNYLIDVGTKTIHPIDFGQGEYYSLLGSFSADDRLHVVEFLRGIRGREPARIVRAAQAMSSTKSRALTARELSKLEAVTAEKLMSHSVASPAERLTEIVNGLSGAGVRLERRFSFGILKGLMIFHGEKYVDEKEFTEILAAESKRLLLRKAPYLAQEAVKGCVQGFRQLGRRR